MGEHVIKLPDVGEGVAEAELVEWLVKEGENVREDQVLAAVMTDKATVEIPSPVDGKVKWLGAKIGEIVAVGSAIIKLDVDGVGNVKPDAEPALKKNGAAKAEPAPTAPPAPLARGAGEGPGAVRNEPAQGIKPPLPQARESKQASAAMPRKEGEKPLAAPAVRKRAQDAGVDLRRVPGTGPAGRITHEDLDAFFESGGAMARSGGKGRAPDASVKDVPVIGLRRKIAEKMTIATSRIPHITYVDDIDMTALEDLRGKLNAEKVPGRPKLTLLPFLMRAMAKAIAEQPHLNSRYDDEAGIVRQYGGVHIGIATQTPNGLMVPVVRHVEALGLYDCAAEMARLAEAAKSGSASREELTGSTITITSLGAIGGIVTTPVINHPEVAIIGVNKMQIAPHWDGAAFVPRKKMNLSSSFDHRIIDGWDAAVFVQRIKALLESPAMIFIED